MIGKRIEFNSIGLFDVQSLSEVLFTWLAIIAIIAMITIGAIAGHLWPLIVYIKS